ncbi:MAG: methionyl-tRNA formyltransferase [Tissierellia bacterium]|nr:methionyl-tRNA formyltransferase [Tissierellia bacterium]
MINIVFMGTPEFSVASLEKLAKNENIKVSLVITQEDKKRGRNKVIPTPVKAKALELGIESYEPIKVNSKESLDKIDSINPDFIVVIAYGQIIGSHLLEKYENRIINIHSSLLPKYRGAAPMQEALLNDDKITGVCSMLIEKSMDTGDVLDCVTMPINDRTTIEDIHDNLSVLASDLILNTILNYDQVFANRTKQDDSKASYSKKITKEMGHLDMTLDARTIDLKVRAFKNWPSTFIYIDENPVKIHKISIIDKYNNIEPGKIFKVDDTGIYVNANDKCIVIEEIQFPNKKKMTVSDYIKGNTIEAGTLLK